MSEKGYDGSLAIDEAKKENVAIEAERIDDVGTSKHVADSFTAGEERRLVRKLDFWYEMELSSVSRDMADTIVLGSFHS